MNIVLVDDLSIWKNLLPLTYTRPVSGIRIGILTIAEKWQLWTNAPCTYITTDHLAEKFTLKVDQQSIFIKSNICPDNTLVNAITKLQNGEALYLNEEWIAFKGELKDLKESAKQKKIQFEGSFFSVKNVWDIFQKNGEAIRADFEKICSGRKSATISETVTIIGNKQDVFLEEGAKAEACIINTTSGPVYLGKDSEIMEGSVVRGPLALCEHSALKLSTKIYGPTTIGPNSKVGGEINNSVIFGYSNKAHDGFIGNSVIGEWCNLGADTNCSNLKNNYANVKLFNYLHNKPSDTGLQFCGLIMGDHSKSGINTMFNTGTVTGVGANIFGGGFPATHIPSFSWGGAQGLETYRLEKLFETAEKVFERRGLKFDDKEKKMLKSIFEMTAEFRND